MQLTTDEHTFLADPENWRYGPTYDLTLRFQPDVSTEMVRGWLFGLPGVMPWRLPGADSTLLVVRRPELLAWPVGLLYYSWRSWSGHGTEMFHSLVLYPRQFERVCGTDTQFSGPGHPVGIVGLHRVLLWLVDMLVRAFPVSGVCLSDEVHGSVVVPGRLVVVNEAVARLGLHGDPLPDEQYEQWQSFPLEHLPRLIGPEC